MQVLRTWVLIVGVVWATGLLGTHAKAAVSSTEAKPPQVAQKFSTWEALFAELLDRSAYYTAMAASNRLLTVFSDVKAQELAYKTAIWVSDQGHPLPIKQWFLTSTLEPDTPLRFAQDFYFFKALANQDRGTKKWADHYLKKLAVNPPEKLIYFDALKAYGARDIPKAKELLLKLLEPKTDPLGAVFVSRIARMLARIYFEEKNYQASLDVYQSFLLQLPWVKNSDWLETAWDFYYLKRYGEAIGALFNLEAPSNRDSLHLEKYVIRGLIYQQLCDRPRMDALLKTFESKYKNLVMKIKTGEPLSKMPELRKVRTPKTEEYANWLGIAQGLKDEQKQLTDLPGSLRSLVKYVNQTEADLLAPQMKRMEEHALEVAAEELVLTHESLRFLNFEIEKARVDPAKIFAKKKSDDVIGSGQADLPKKEGFWITWTQAGDFWRDERLKYFSEVKSQCE